MTQNRDAPTNLLLFSGGLLSFHLMCQLKEEGVEFECLHFLDSPNSVELGHVEHFTSSAGIKLYTLDVTHLYHALKPKNCTAFFDFGSQQWTSPNALRLMLSLADCFAEQHGFNVIFVGFDSSQGSALPPGFLIDWNKMLGGWTDEEDEYFGVEPKLRVEAPFRIDNFWLEPSGADASRTISHSDAQGTSDDTTELADEFCC
jgi:hypothetical protein